MTDLEKLATTDNEKATKIIQHIYSWMVGLDMMENIANDSDNMRKIGYYPKQELKRLNNKFNKSCKEVNKELKKQLGNDGKAEKFGDTADFLQELFEIAMFIPAEQRIKLLSNAKILVKNAN